MSATEREEHAMRILMVITPESTAYGVSAVRSATQMARSAAGESGWRTYARSHPRA